MIVMLVPPAMCAVARLLLLLEHCGALSALWLSVLFCIGAGSKARQCCRRGRKAAWGQVVPVCTAIPLTAVFV